MRTGNVLVVVHSGFLGGAERSMLDCAASIHADADYFVHIACPGGSRVDTEARRLDLVTHSMAFPAYEGAGRPPRFARAMAATLNCARELRDLMEKLKIGLVHGNGIKSSIPAALAARWSGVPLVYHVRDYARRRFVNRVVSSMSSICIAPTEFMRNGLGAPRGRCVVIPNGIEAPPCGSPGTFRRAHGIADTVPVVAMVAQMAPWKRHDVFVDAAGIVSRQHRDAVFCIAGADIGGLNKPYVERLCRRAEEVCPSGAVRFLGHVDEVGSLLQDSDVLVLPSDNEPFGRVVVESWHCGTAVVVSSRGGPAELVKDGVTGLVAEQGSARSFAEKIASLLSDVAMRDRMATAGKAQAQRFDVALHARRVAALYRELERSG